MNWKESIKKIESAKTNKELEEVRTEILYGEHKLNKTEMFLLGEYIEFRRSYLWKYLLNY